MHTEQELWQNALVHIEMNITDANFRTWFKDTTIVRYDGSTAVIGAPNKFVKDWLSEKYHKFILKILRGIDDSVRAVEYTVAKPSARSTAAQALHTRSEGPQMAMQEVFVDKRDNLNPRYTFETFVIGPFNQLAHAAAQAVIQNPGLAYNPLFVYGGTGHGKTHLIQAIGNHYKKTHPDAKVFYVTSERFAVDFINSVRTGKANSFKDKYRQYDMLIMDDVQFIADKEKTQDELFHLFNTLYDNNKQIVFSSDKHPNFLLGLEERLKSRFSVGMIAEVPAPDLESRISILTTKARSHGFNVPKEIIDYIAKEVPGNIRELEGILNSLMCKTQLKGKELNLSEVHQVVKQNARPTKNIPIEEVVRKISDYYNIDPESIYKKTRKKEVVLPRQVIMFILREDFNISYPSIGDKLGGRDHTTVIHSCEKIKNDIKTNMVLDQEINRIRSLVVG